jgi:anion-transporting  ArsA/GET3 family ATPase
LSLRDVIADNRLIVCVGSGGVGKTTTAAAIALHGALNGCRSMVLTIDPAKRLAQSLGLETLTGGALEIAEESLRAAAPNAGALGTLTAGMLDQKSAWDDFITRHAPNAETRDTILANEFYQHLSQSFAGSAEYMAIEELCRIDESGDYDLIVLDTPPTRHALDFLEAPRRLEDFLDRSVIAWFVRPYASVGWTAWKTASRTVRFLFDRIEDATGVQSLAQISSFFVAMEALFEGINERGQRVRELLAGPSAAFVLVAGPDEQILGESEIFAQRMAELGMPLKGVVMNRLHGCVGDAVSAVDADDLTASLISQGVSADIAQWLVRTHCDTRRIAESEEMRRESFERGLPESVAVAAVPEFEHDVHDLADLAKIAELLCD